MGVGTPPVTMAVDTHQPTTVVIRRAITTDMHPFTRDIGIAGSFGLPMLIMEEAPVTMVVGTGAIATGKLF